jgi:hypothetical protein
MPVTYSFVIEQLFVGTQGEMADVVREVRGVLRGEEDGCTFDVPVSVALGNAYADGFVAYEELTAEMVEEWIAPDTNEQFIGERNQIAAMLTHMVAQKQLQSKPMPWASNA